MALFGLVSQNKFSFSNSFGRLILMTKLMAVSVALVPSHSFASSSAIATSLSSAQLQFLNQVKELTIQTVEDKKSEAEKLIKCFYGLDSCPNALKTQLPWIRDGILQKNEEYRFLVALANYQGEPSVAISASIGWAFPNVIYASAHVHDSELEQIDELYEQDIVAIKKKALLAVKPHQVSTYYSPVGDLVHNEKKAARRFYQMQAMMLLTQVPFVQFLNIEHPTDKQIAKALKVYVEKLNATVMSLYDEQESPLESFLMYTPMVRKVIGKSWAKIRIYESFRDNKQVLVGMEAWLQRNAPSLKLAAFSTCSFVSAVMQVWPISLTCGGAAFALTSKQLFYDYLQMKETMVLWMTGVETKEHLQEHRGRLVYSSLSLLLVGQGVGSTLFSMEQSLSTILSQLPTQAAARFTSLAALREGGLKFLERTVENKGKDLGASLIGGVYTEIADPRVKLQNRRDRLFTYADLLRLQSLNPK